MRIERIEALALSIPLSRDFGGSTYHVTRRCAVVTRLFTSDGVRAEVFNGDNREHGGDIVRLIHERLAPLAIGASVFEIERIWERMFALTHTTGDKKLLIEAIACVDCALWDAVGRTTGRSVRELLGGYRVELPILSIGGYYVAGKTLADIGREIESYRAAGMAGCKFKVGGLTPEEDARRVEAARAAAGPDFTIVVDANRGWTAQDAIRFGRLVEPLDIGWFEEPCHWYDDAAMMARVRHAIRIPVNAGQCEITSYGVRRLVDAGAVDYVNFDASEGGGVTDWRRAAAICHVAGVRMAHHEEAQIAAHLLGAVPYGTFVECFADPERDPIWQRVWSNRPQVKDGCYHVPDGPGFDIELDSAAIERHRIA